jgi:hypothetical protein
LFALSSGAGPSEIAELGNTAVAVRSLNALLAAVAEEAIVAGDGSTGLALSGGDVAGLGAVAIHPVITVGIGSTRRT